VLGVGYDNIGALLEGHMSVHDAASLLFLKAAVWLIALGSCTSGGVLAPLLMIGGAVGELCGIILPSGHPGFWALLGMTGIMAGTMRTPLTATLFAAELTGNFDSLAPLIGVSGVAYGLTVLLMKRSILTEKLARRGYHVTREYALDVFHLTRVREVMAKTVDTLPAAMTAADAIAFFTGAKNHHRSYPVVDDAGKLIGMVSRADILRLIGGDSEPGLTLGKFVAGQEIVTAAPDELLSELVDHMVATDTGRVPIVEPRDGKLVGLVSRKDVLKVRHTLTEHEKRRERLFFNGKRAASS
jgi:CBS domain-containing protein